MTTDSPESIRKAQINAVLLKLPGVSTRKINGLHAYFVADRMFACISGQGVGLRLPVANPAVSGAPGSGSRSTVPPRPNPRRISTCFAPRWNS
jgi:hypothetical protein